MRLNAFISAIAMKRSTSSFSVKTLPRGLVVGVRDARRRDIRDALGKA